MTTQDVHKLREDCKMYTNVQDNDLAMRLIDALTLLLDFMYNEGSQEKGGQSCLTKDI